LSLLQDLFQKPVRLFAQRPELVRRYAPRPEGFDLGASYSAGQPTSSKAEENQKHHWEPSSELQKSYLTFYSYGPPRITSDRCSTHSSKLRVTFLFGKTFRTFTDLLERQFELVHLFERHILKGSFDECRVPAKERDEHLSFLFQLATRSLRDDLCCTLCG
jgi:hypothetical protein